MPKIKSFVYTIKKYKIEVRPLTTFMEIQYPSATGTIRNMLVETHIFIFHRIKEDGLYKFIPNKEML